MIVRDEWDYAKLDGPMLCREPWHRPIGINEAFDPGTVRCDQIIFAPEYDTDVHFPDCYVKVWDVPWRWYCQDCYAACGDRNRVFKTKWVKREDLRGRGNRDRGGFSEPTYEQTQEMGDHARQHQIMWSWARGVK